MSEEEEDADEDFKECCGPREKMVTPMVEWSKLTGQQLASTEASTEMLCRLIAQ